MTPNEFKAWFEGFTEFLDGPPNKAQWKRIKARVDQIDGHPVTERVFIDRLWPRIFATERVQFVSLPQPTMTITPWSGSADDNGQRIKEAFRSQNAMQALGVADYQAVNHSG